MPRIFVVHQLLSYSLTHLNDTEVAERELPGHEYPQHHRIRVTVNFGRCCDDLCRQVHE